MFAYLDDFLTSSSTREEAEENTHALLPRLSGLGFSINGTKSVLSPTQNIDYLGLFKPVCREVTFCQHVDLFHKGNMVSLRTRLPLTEMMTSVISVIPQALLRMWDFQRWVSFLRLDVRHHLSRMVRISPECLLALCHWRDPKVFTTGIRYVGYEKSLRADGSFRGF